MAFTNNFVGRQRIIENKDLPEELVSEILVRLPVKSLLRFKIVCKSWCSTINSLSLNNHRYLLFDTTTTYYEGIGTLTKTTTFPRISYDTLRTVQTILGPHPLIDHEIRGIYHISCTCNGLILFDSDTFNDAASKWLLWNPTTRQTKLLPPSPSSEALELKQNYKNIIYQNVGFGFDTKTMDYKVVLIYKYYTAGIAAGTVVLEMYSLKTNSWKSKAATYNNNSHKDLRINKYWPGVFSNGTLSWKASYKGNGDIRYTNAIISVDLSSDSIITTTPLPSSISHKHPPSDYKNNYCLDYKDSLALVHCYTQARIKSFDIWVLGEYGVKESWKKLFTIGPLREIGRVLGFYDDGKVFLQTYYKKFRSNVSEKELLLLDTLSPTQRPLRIFRGNYIKMFTCRECLVPLKS